MSWLVGSISEPQFYAVAPAGALLLVGGLVGHVAHRRSWRWQGFVQACGSGFWPWAAGSALISLLLGNLAWGWTAAVGDWQPLVSMAPAIVVLYGPGWRVGLTAAVLGALLTPPASILAVAYLYAPLDLPPVVGATTGMWRRLEGPSGEPIRFFVVGAKEQRPACHSAPSTQRHDG